MPFAMRMGKGVRISASPRGLRAHLGPRGARLHVGSGRPTVSTGKGPFTYYTGFGSGASSGGRPSAADKEQAFLRLREAFEAILEIHRVEFPPAERPEAPPIETANKDAIRKTRVREQLAGIPVWKFAARKAAKAEAVELAADDARIERERLERERATQQEQLDRSWERLLRNDPATVIDAVDEAFEDNAAPATPVAVEDSVLSLVMLAPQVDAIPERKPALTPAGNPTTKNLTKTEAADTYLTLVCGHLLATMKEALAVAPAITEIKAVAVRRTERDVYGETHLEVVLAGRYPRANLDRVRWDESLAPDIVQQAATELTWQLKGRPRSLVPLELDQEPELKVFVDTLDQDINE